MYYVCPIKNQNRIADIRKGKEVYYDTKAEKSFDTHYHIRRTGAGIQPNTGGEYLYKARTFYDTVSGHRV